MTSEYDRSAKYDILISNLLDIKNQDINDFNEIKNRLTQLESQNIQLADLFEQMTKVLRGNPTL